MGFYKNPVLLKVSLTKVGILRRCFPINCANFFRAATLKNTFEKRLLNIFSRIFKLLRKTLDFSGDLLMVYFTMMLTNNKYIE